MLYCEEFRLFTTLEADANPVIRGVENKFGWQTGKAADLKMKCCNKETFFKLLKQSLQVKTFQETSENAVKSQMLVQVISNLLVGLNPTVYCNEKACFIAELLAV